MLRLLLLLLLLLLLVVVMVMVMMLLLLLLLVHFDERVGLVHGRKWSTHEEYRTGRTAAVALAARRRIVHGVTAVAQATDRIQRTNHQFTVG